MRETHSHLTGAEYLLLFHPLFSQTPGVTVPPPYPFATVRYLNKPRDVSVRSDRIHSHFVAETSDRKFVSSSFSSRCDKDYR